MVALLTYGYGEQGLLYADLCAWVSAAGKRTFFHLFEEYSTSFCGVDSEVFADVGTWAGNFSATGLAYEYFAFIHFLATKALNAQASAGVVVDVLARTTCFDV